MPVIYASRNPFSDFRALFRTSTVRRTVPFPPAGTFVITHFTKGPGFDTLSTKIYTEVRKGIKPEMYALSTLLFVSVLLLLLLFGRGGSKGDAPQRSH